MACEAEQLKSLLIKAPFIASSHRPKYSSATDPGKCPLRTDYPRG